MSYSSKGPRGMPNRRETLSIRARSTPSRNSSTDSCKYGVSTRFTRNPGLSRTTTGTFLSRFACSTTAATVESLVSGPRMTSTNDIRRTGLKKCIPQNRAGSESAVARVAIGFVDVLVHITVLAETTASISASTFCLKSVRSVTLSTTISEADIAESCVEDIRRPVSSLTFL